MIRVVVLLSCCLYVMPLKAKTIFVGFGGGYEMYTGSGGSVEYDPVVQNYANNDPSWIAENVHGIDAISKSLENRISGTYRARIFKENANLDNVMSWVSGTYRSGDKIVLVGYSAGAGIATRISEKLKFGDKPVHVLGLIDEVSNVGNLIVGNVHRAYVYYQKRHRGQSLKENPVSGQDDFVLQDEHFTNAQFIRVYGVTHATIDESEMVWKSFAIFASNYADNTSLHVSAETGSSSPNPDQIEDVVSTEQVQHMGGFYTNPKEGYSLGDLLSDEDSSTSTGDPDLSIKRFKIKEAGTNIYVRNLYKHLLWGESFYVRGELKLRNKGNGEAEDVDIDYRIDHGRNFDTNDTKVDENGKLDIDPNDHVIKKMDNIRVEVSTDGTYINTYRKNGSFAESFPFTEGYGKFYIFVDAEADDGDDDISSEHSSHNEYGVVHVLAVNPNPTPEPQTRRGFSPAMIMFILED